MSYKVARILRTLRSWLLCYFTQFACKLASDTQNTPVAAVSVLSILRTAASSSANLHFAAVSCRRDANQSPAGEEHDDTQHPEGWECTVSYHVKGTFSMKSTFAALKPDCPALSPAPLHAGVTRIRACWQHA